MITIVDYGTGNLASMANMLKKAGHPARIASRPEEVAGATRLILPGVGAFDTGMRLLRERGLVAPLEERVRGARVPVLGVCLGYQMLARSSEEGALPGLGWLDASVVRFRPGKDAAAIRVPHMGWNRVRPLRAHPLLRGLEEGARFYFVHSFHLVADRPEDVLGETTHGVPFASAMGRGNILGVQFHPEKSHAFGLRLLRNFAEWDGAAPDAAVGESSATPADPDADAARVGLRVIPVLLLAEDGLVKTVRFRSPTYVGDPINAVRIFNEKEVDELVVLDIRATPEGRGPDFDRIRDLAAECFMPLCYGGGVRDLEDIRRLVELGVEKVAVNTRAVEEPEFVRAAAAAFGSSTIVASMDVRRGMFGRRTVCGRGGTRDAKRDPVEHARLMEAMGAGEILLNSIDRDGRMEGYDLELLRSVAGAVSVPVIACGGAGSLADLHRARDAGAAAAAAGSLFVFQGPHRAVLISYPRGEELAAARGDA